MCVDIHPANPHIVYLKINGTIVSYDLEKNIMEFLYEIRDGNYLFFTNEWHQWPPSSSLRTINKHSFAGYSKKWKSDSFAAISRIYYLI
uniref:Putative ovule protein n=1 Tax=Solanum chacoense TaxID=4108 RepID=A0A0V0GPM0_SOLCH